jgi:hypothetical protein
MNGSKPANPCYVVIRSILQRFAVIPALGGPYAKLLAMSASTGSVCLDATDVLISRVGFGGSMLCRQQVEAFGRDLADDPEAVLRFVAP